MVYMLIAGVIYYKNAKEYFVHMLKLWVPGTKDSRLVPFAVWLALCVLLMIAIRLVFVPERLKFPSLIGCAIILLCFWVFWANNFLTPLGNLSGVKPVVWGNLFPLLSASAYCYEGLIGYFPVRSSMKDKSKFLKVLRLSYATMLVSFVVNCVSFYLVELTRNSAKPSRLRSTTTRTGTRSSTCWKSFFICS